jgi:hypothetical protein
VNHNISLQDIVFRCGHLNIHKQTLQVNKVFSFLLCKINLGKIGTIRDQENINSILIDPEDTEEAFQYNYSVLSHDQYEIKYEVRFTVSDDK